MDTLWPHNTLIYFATVLFFEYLILLAVSFGIWGVWGACPPPPEALTFNECKNQWNTSDPPPNTWWNIWPPLPQGIFIFNPPQYITKKIPTPPEYNRPPHLVINNSSLRAPYWRYKATQLSACYGASTCSRAGERSRSGGVRSVARRALTLLNAPQKNETAPCGKNGLGAKGLDEISSSWCWILPSFSYPMKKKAEKNGRKRGHRSLRQYWWKFWSGGVLNNNYKHSMRNFIMPLHFECGN